MGSVTALDVGRPSLVALSGYVMGFWCVPVAAQCSIYRRWGGCGGGENLGRWLPPWPHRPTRCCDPVQSGCHWQSARPASMATAHVYKAHAPPRASPPTWAPSRAAHVSTHCQRGGGRRERLGGLRAERSNTLFACRNGFVGRGGGAGRGGSRTSGAVRALGLPATPIKAASMLAAAGCCRARGWGERGGEGRGRTRGQPRPDPMASVRLALVISGGTLPAGPLRWRRRDRHCRHLVGQSGSRLGEGPRRGASSAP